MVTIKEMEQEGGFAYSKINDIIKRMGIVAIKRGRNNALLFTVQQKELILSDDARYYEPKYKTWLILESKMNF